MCKIRHLVNRDGDRGVFVQLVNEHDEYRGMLIMPDDEWKLYQSALLDGKHRFQDGEFEVEFIVGGYVHAYLKGE